MIVLRQPLGSLLLGLSADLSNHDDSLGLGVVHELGEHIDEVGSVERITTDTDNGGLAEAESGGLIDSLVRQRAGSRDDSDFTLGVDVSWHNSDLALSWLDNTWAVWSNKSGPVLRVHDGLNLDHVESWDTLGDANYEVHLGLNSLQDSIGGERWWHVDDRSVSLGGLLGLGHVSEHWEVQMSGSSLSLVHSTDNIGSVLNRLLGMESSLRKSDLVYLNLRACRSYLGRGPWCAR